MAALLLDIQAGDEVIVPSYTFPSTANAFRLRGARIVFADSQPHHPNMDAGLLDSLINERTRAIVPVHYAGMACDMDRIMELAEQHDLYVVEDAAQAINSYHKGRPLGSIGDLGAISFHETKNLSAGEGGLLAVNREQFVKRAEIIREKGTNRTAFFRGEVNKYGWMDVGSSFLPSDIIAAVLYAQIDCLQEIQARRLAHWTRYHEGLRDLETAGNLHLPHIPEYATNNAHIFYLICRDVEERGRLIKHLKGQGIQAIFHYLPLHSSPYFKEKHDGRPLPWAEYYADRLLRLPLFVDLTEGQIDFIIEQVRGFYKLP
jgi:dTDP-4-amino-4,6-dideoxygalactose transaminase